MIFRKPANKKSQLSYRVIGQVSQVRVIEVQANTPDEAVAQALKKPKWRFRVVDQHMKLTGVRLMDENSKVSIFEPIFHSPYPDESQL